MQRKACLHSKLSMPVSYAYVPYISVTQSQLLSWNIRVFFFGIGIGPGAELVEEYPSGSLGVVDSACDYRNEILEHTGLTSTGEIKIFHVQGTHAGAQTSLDGFPLSAFDDDGVTPIRGTYPRLREGAERFMITDINNPAAGAKGQSTIMAMFDAWSNGETYQTFLSGGSYVGTLTFNHIPGGSNVLYMDGHVEFVKLEQKPPMLLKGLSPTSNAGLEIGAGDYRWTFWEQNIGHMAGWG